MLGFLSPAVTGFGKSVARGRLSPCRVRQNVVSMKISPAMPFMEQPSVLDDSDIPGNAGFDPLNLGTLFNFKYMQVRLSTSSAHIKGNRSNNSL